MMPALSVLLNMFVRQFYKVNAGLFLFFFLFFFGIVNPAIMISYHLSLIMGMIQTPLFLTGVMLFWLSYNVKCVAFCNKVLTNPDNIFLFNLQCFSMGGLWGLFFFIHILLYLPILVYAGVVTGIAFSRGYSVVGVILLTSQLALCILSAYAYCRVINRSWKDRGMTVLSLLLRPLGNGRKPYPFYLIFYTAYHRKVSVLAIKFFSFFLLYITFFINRNDFEPDIFLVLYLMIIAAHALLVFYYVEFIEKRLSFYRNLPLSLPKIGSIYIITYIVLMLPELLYLLVNARASLPVPEILYLYGIAVVNLFLFTAILYLGDMSMKGYLKIVFAIFFVSIFMLKSGEYLVSILIEGAIAAGIFLRNYYAFERKVKN